MRFPNAFWNPKAAVLHRGELPCFARGKIGWFTRRQERSDQALSSAKAWGCHRMHSGEYWRSYNAQRPCGFRYRDVWAAKRPAAAEGDVQAHSEPACLTRRKAQIIDELVRQIGKVAEALRGI